MWSRSQVMSEYLWIAVEWVLAQDFSVDRKADMLRRIGEGGP